MRRFAVVLCTVVFTSFQIRAADIRQGLVAYWQMDSTDGVTTPDATPYNNHLNVVNVGPGNLVAGQFGNAAQFNGTSAYMTNIHSTDPSLSGLPIYRAGSYTITLWVKGPAQTARYLYSEANTNIAGSTAGQTPIVIFQTGQAAANNNKFDVIIRNDAGVIPVNHVVSSTVVFDDNWHHIAWVDDRGSVKLYIDGVLDAANFNYVPSGNFTLNTSTVGALTRAAVQGFFNGLIDDVALWRRALSAAEVQEVRTSSIMTPIPTFPPLVLGQPRGSTNHVGDRVTFTAIADGSAPLSFQWFKDAVEEVPGANSASLSLSNLSVGDSGVYTLRVTNPFGTNFSIAAPLLVIPDAAPDLRAAIASYWNMDDEPDDPFTGNGTLLDNYGHNTFKVVADGGFIDLGPGVSTNAATFNGVNQYAFRDGGFPIYNNSGYTVAFWVKGNGTNQNDRRIFAESSIYSSLPVFSLGSQGTGANGTLRALVRSGNGPALLDRTSSRAVLDGTWHHVAWTETNGEVRLYIDGSLDETSFNYNRGTLLLDQTTIAALLNPSGATNFFNGALDELAVWSRPLSFTEVQQLLTNGVPGALSNSPPLITAQPASQSVFTRATVSFAFAAAGTGPLSVQWRRNGTNLSAQTNATLLLPSVTLADAANYDVVITNALGRATSELATLSVTARPNTPDLKIDFNNPGPVDDVPVNTEPGFSSFALDVAATPGPLTRLYGGAEVTLASVGAINMQSRKRPMPTNDLAFSEEKLLQDFVFAADTTLDQGMDITLNFLEPNSAYETTIWSYDNVSAGNRVSDWFANGVLVKGGYSFNGSALPIDNSTYRFTFTAVSDAQGKIVIQGRRSPAATVANNVFINALRAVRREMRVQRIQFEPPGGLRLTVQVINPAATHTLEQTTSLENPVWTTVLNASFEPPVGNEIDVFFGVPDTATRFYRVVETP